MPNECIICWQRSRNNQISMWNELTDCELRFSLDFCAFSLTKSEQFAFRFFLFCSFFPFLKSKIYLIKFKELLRNSIILAVLHHAIEQLSQEHYFHRIQPKNMQSPKMLKEQANFNKPKTYGNVSFDLMMTMTIAKWKHAIYLVVDSFAYATRPNVIVCIQTK